MIAEARAEGLPLTVETCPHYLTFAAEEIPDGDPRFKCAPPIRSAGEPRAALGGPPRGPDRHDRHRPLPGPAGLEAPRHGRPGAGLGRDRLAPALAAGRLDRGPPPRVRARRPRPLDGRSPAGLVGLAGRKGAIAPGRDADLVVVRPRRRRSSSTPASLHHRHPATPYEGRTLVGRVVATYLRGARIASATAVEPDGPAVGPDARRRARPAQRAWTTTRPARAAPLLRLAPLGRPDGRPPAVRHDGRAARRRRRVWDDLDRADRLEAFAAHPKIGDLDALRAKFAVDRRLGLRRAGGRRRGRRGDPARPGRGEPRLRGPVRPHLHRLRHRQVRRRDARPAPRAARQRPRGRARRSPPAEQAKITRIRLRKLCP